MINYIKLFFLLAFATSLMHCGGGGSDPVPETAAETLINDIASKTWTIDNASSNLDNVSGVDLSNTTVSFSKTTGGINIALNGDVSNYISGGTVVFNDNGSVSQVSYTAVSGFDVASANFSVNSAVTQITVSFNVTESGGRTSGIGSYTVVFTGS